MKKDLSTELQTQTDNYWMNPGMYALLHPSVAQLTR